MLRAAEVDALMLELARRGVFDASDWVPSQMSMPLYPDCGFSFLCPALLIIYAGMHMFVTADG